MRQFFDIVHQAIELPLTIDLPPPAQREPIQPLVVPDVAEDRFDGGEASPVEDPALESEELRHDGLDDVDLAAGKGLAHELFGGGEIGFAGGELFVADHLADMFVTIDDLPYPEPTNGLGGGFVDNAQYGGEGVLGFLRLLLQIEFGVVLDGELINQGLGFLEGSGSQAELDFSLRGIQVLDVLGNPGAKVIDITALVKPCLLCHATVLFRRRCTSPVYHSDL